MVAGGWRAASKARLRGAHDGPWLRFRWPSLDLQRFSAAGPLLPSQRVSQGDILGGFSTVAGPGGPFSGGNSGPGTEAGSAGVAGWRRAGAGSAADQADVAAETRRRADSGFSARADKSISRVEIIGRRVYNKSFDSLRRRFHEALYFCSLDLGRGVPGSNDADGK